MALSLEERKLAQTLKQSGKNNTEVMRIIAKRRVEGTTTTDQVFAAEPKPSAGVFSRAVVDIPSDLGEVFKGATDAVAGGIETASAVRERVESGETSPVAGTFQTIGAGLRAGAEVIGQGVLGVGKLFTTPEAEKAIGEGVQSGVEILSQTAPAKEIIRQYEALTPEQKRNVQGALGAAEGLTTAFGFAPIVSKLKGVISETAATALRQSDDTLRSAASRLPEIPKVDVPAVSGLIKDIRFALSDVDPQVQTVLQRSNFDEVNQYFQQARNAKLNPAKATPLELAGTKAEVAYDAISDARRAAVQGKKAILERVATERVPGNTVNEVMSRGIQRIKERFGADVSSKGEISQATGRTLQLDAADQKLISEYMSRLNALGVSPSVKQVDDFVDWAQSQLYKQSKSISKFEVAAEPVVRELQGITGDLNTRLKEIVGGGYGEVNARVSRLIELQDELSRALGADARKGGGLMKRVFSPAAGNLRDIFEEIRKETGIDLIKEATLAKFAMEGVGDVRQQSLLKQLDILAQEGAEFDLAKPLSIIKFIREKADLDAQELANEIIRRTNASNP